MKTGQSIAIAGTGNFSVNLEALCREHDLNVAFFVDEFRTDAFLGKPVYQAKHITGSLIDSISCVLIAISHPEYQVAAAERLQKQGFSDNRIFTLADDPALQILQLLLERDADALRAAIGSEDFNSLEQIEAHFLGHDWRKTMSSLDPSKQNVALGYYGRGGGFRRHISPLIPHLSKRFNVVSMSDEVMKRAEESKHHLYMSASTASEQSFIDLSISAHIFNCAPKHVPRVSFSHVIYDFNLMGDYHAARIGEPDTHYLFASSRPCFDWYKDLISRHQLKNKLCIIPGGYLQLDNNIARVNEYQGERDSILYAPTLALADYPNKELASSIEYAPELVRTLLESFPHKKVIVRPHPSDLRMYKLQRKDQLSEVFTELLDICSSHPRCVLDDNPTSYINSYQRSCLMVSDTSSTAFTYAFSTGRPVVFFSPKESDLLCNIGKDLKFIDDRSNIGAIAKTCKQVSLLASELLSKNGEETNQATSFRDKVIFNPGESANYFLNNIEFIIKAKKHPDWLYINWE